MDLGYFLNNKYGYNVLENPFINFHFWGGSMGKRYISISVIAEIGDTYEFITGNKLVILHKPEPSSIIIDNNHTFAIEQNLIDLGVVKVV